MRIRLVPFVFVCLVLTAMASVAQAESAIMNQSEPMRLTKQQINTITAGDRDRIISSHAFGTHSSHSISTITTLVEITKGYGIAAFCCGTKAYGHVTISSYITKLSPNILAHI